MLAGYLHRSPMRCALPCNSARESRSLWLRFDWMQCYIRPQTRLAWDSDRMSEAISAGGMILGIVLGLFLSRGISSGAKIASLGDTIGQEYSRRQTSDNQTLG
jgi:hypothetical protein